MKRHLCLYMFFTFMLCLTLSRLNLIVVHGAGENFADAAFDFRINDILPRSTKGILSMKSCYQSFSFNRHLDYLWQTNDVPILSVDAHKTSANKKKPCRKKEILNMKRKTRGVREVSTLNDGNGLLNRRNFYEENFEMSKWASIRPLICDVFDSECKRKPIRIFKQLQAKSAPEELGNARKRNDQRVMLDALFQYVDNFNPDLEDKLFEEQFIELIKFLTKTHEQDMPYLNSLKCENTQKDHLKRKIAKAEQSGLSNSVLSLSKAVFNYPLASEAMLRWMEEVLEEQIVWVETFKEHTEEVLTCSFDCYTEESLAEYFNKVQELEDRFLKSHIDEEVFVKTMTEFHCLGTQLEKKDLEGEQGPCSHGEIHLSQEVLNALYESALTFLTVVSVFVFFHFKKK